MRELIDLVPVLRKAYGKWMSFIYLILITLFLFRLHVIIAVFAGIK